LEVIANETLDPLVPGSTPAVDVWATLISIRPGTPLFSLEKEFHFLNNATDDPIIGVPD